MTSRGTRYWSNGSIPLIGPEVLGDIISSAADISLVITGIGEILSVMVNPGHPRFGRLDSWEGRDLRNLLQTESIPKLEARLAAIAGGDSPSRGIELNHTDTTGLGFPVRYSFHPIGPEGAILMLGRDLRPIAQMQQQLVEAQMALERDYEHQREIATRMKVLMETTQDAVLFVNSVTGRIADLNAQAARMLGDTVDTLVDQPLAQLLTRRDGPFELAALTADAQSETSGPVALQLVTSRKPISLRATPFRAAGQRMLICRIDRAAEGVAPETEASARLARHFDRTADAMVFADRTGAILTANDAFLALVDEDNAAGLKGRSLADFLVRGSVDLKVLIDNAVRNGQMRLFSTRMTGQFGGETPVEISAAFLDDPLHPALGFVFRDVSRVDGVRGASAGSVPEDMRPARELVGAATLRDIVAETTEVIEKMCIETAVELTGNNRVAAAEMLGLSRQSLYVKLRKYDLLARDD